MCVSGGKKCWFFGKFCVRTKCYIKVLLLTELFSQVSQKNVTMLSCFVSKVE